MCRFDSTYVVFVEPATKGGARPAIADEKAMTFSENGFIWNPLPNQLGPVTGKLDSRAYALVFNKLEMIDAKQEIDLWHYADFADQEKPIRMILEPYNKFSTLFCAENLLSKALIQFIWVRLFNCLRNKKGYERTPRKTKVSIPACCGGRSSRSAILRMGKIIFANKLLKPLVARRAAPA